MIGVPERTFAFGPSLGLAELKRSPNDFIVVEQFEPELVEQGEHLALLIEKTGQNTQWVADQLAEHYGLRRVDVGYGGKKDRHGITTQWFSLYVSNKELPPVPTIEGCRIVKQGITAKKIRKGDHNGNWFEITLYTQEPADLDQLAGRVAQIKADGFANYFGNQRFGINGNNVARFDDAVLNDRRLRRSDKGIILSAARSAIFNRLLNMVVQQQLEVSSLPMWGRGRPDDWALQNLGPFEHWRERLEHAGLNMDERATKVLVPDLSMVSRSPTELVFSFTLPPGAYATTLLEHLFDLLERPNY